MKKTLLIASIMTAGLALTGCDKPAESTAKVASTPSPSSSSNTSSEYGKNLPTNAQTYVIAVDGASAPFSFKDEKGNLTGFDIDIIHAIGEKQGFRVETISTPWTGIFSGLNDKKYDIVGTAVAITPERQQQMDFSNSYMNSSIVFATKDPTIQNFSSLAGKKVGVQANTSSADVLKKANFPEANIITYKTDYLLYQALVKGEVSAIIDELALIDSLNVQLKGLTDTTQIKTYPIPNAPTASVGFAIKKGRTDLTDKINKGLAQIKADGTYDKIYQKWFGTAAPQQTASAPVASMAKP